mmetsp:Transcript_12601/g.33257  ORF Transcript_12601/g.33257 Transcript_12601/m.33257 type:complete len:271 (+) Transcript_12601:1024-1836(+)
MAASVAVNGGASDTGGGKPSTASAGPPGAPDTTHSASRTASGSSVADLCGAGSSKQRRGAGAARSATAARQRPTRRSTADRFVDERMPAAVMGAQMLVSAGAAATTAPGASVASRALTAAASQNARWHEPVTQRATPAVPLAAASPAAARASSAGSMRAASSSSAKPKASRRSRGAQRDTARRGASTGGVTRPTRRQTSGGTWRAGCRRVPSATSQSTTPSTMLSKCGQWPVARRWWNASQRRRTQESVAQARGVMHTYAARRSTAPQGC